MVKAIVQQFEVHPEVDSIQFAIDPNNLNSGDRILSQECGGKWNRKC